jgi:hypothetical protein
MISKRSLVIGSLLLFGAAGCTDLDVPTNPNAPDRDQALQSPGDIESLVAGAFQQWWMGTHHSSGPALFFSVASFQHSSTAANFGMLQYSAFPRIPIQNDPTDQEYSYVADVWNRSYRALAGVAEGLRAIDTRPEIAEGLGSDAVLRMRAYGKFMQGLAHATIAAVYHEGWVVDETVETIGEVTFVNLGEPLGYAALMDRAFEYFDEAIEMSEGAAFSLPSDWMSVSVSSDELARLARSLRASFRAATARTPAERADVGQGGLVDWRAVLDDIDAGLSESFNVDMTYITNTWATFPAHVYAGLTAPEGGWQQAAHFVLGMADQSGRYQEWLSLPIAQRRPELPSGRDFIYVTPDLRFPQGETVAEQHANNAPWNWWQIQSSLPNAHTNPGRGTWRWSHYGNITPLYWWLDIVDYPQVEIWEMRLLAAEAHYHLGNHAAAASIVNQSRTQFGLNATDAAGTNTSCVPKLPNEECGDLFEMLKWEKRQMTWMRGIAMASWYFDGRGWGDLYRGTPLDLPVPSDDLIVTGRQVYTRGGIGQAGGAPQSTYAWPNE